MRIQEEKAFSYITWSVQVFCKEASMMYLGISYMEA